MSCFTLLRMRGVFIHRLLQMPKAKAKATLTDSVTERLGAARQAHYRKRQVNISDQTEKWGKKIKEQLGPKLNQEVA